MDAWRNRSRRRLPASALPGVLLALTACAVGPNFTKPETAVSPTWNARADPRVVTQTAVNSLWWKSFNDSALDRLVELAYRQNLQLQVSGLRIVEARAQLGLATGKQFPLHQLFGSVSGIRLSEDAPGVGGAPVGHYWDYQAGFDAVWELDFWGKLRRGVEVEAASLIASEADHSYALVSLTAEVARTYVVIRTYEVLIEQARENARIQEQALGIAESRFRNGATSELDVAQATTLLESTRASIPQLQISLQQGHHALSTLLGQPAGAVEPLLVGPKEIPKPPATVPVSVPAEMLRRRPDIRRAEFTAAAQSARIGVAKADLYPRFSLFGRIGLEASSLENGSSNGSRDALSNVFYSFGPTLNWPFFSYGRIQNSIRIEEARYEQLLVSYRDTVLKAAQEVEDTLSGFVNARDAVVFEQRSVDAALRSVEIALIEYREGAADYQRVLDAQRSLLQQQNNLVSSSSAVTTNLIALYKALGGGWELRQGQPIVPESAQGDLSKRTDLDDLFRPPQPLEITQTPPPVKP